MTARCVCPLCPLGPRCPLAAGNGCRAGTGAGDTMAGPIGPFTIAHFGAPGAAGKAAA